ncbi:Nucleoside diphosphate kinase 7 [Holothuria leucospilota]|uniref:Nucleoside diphosphate kinase 7 n=1 Tax=Holothuria leucospilota TaxID=206669 RepID=A0A9Q1BXX0_HOLLE|nr:Nucleoside diphosphate kinase 7 [Holothuria leucospilota]
MELFSESLSSSDEDSDDEDPLMAWHQERRKALARAQEVKVQESSADVCGSVSKKDRDKLPRPPRVIPLTDETTSKSQPGSSKLGERVPPTPPQSPAAATPPRKDSSASKELEKRQRAEIMKRLREEREAERQSRCRLQSQLNAMKPTTSSSKKHPAAQNTPIVFDMDSSYSVSPEPLPSFLRPEDEIVLLTVHLSKLGELATPRSSDGPLSNSGTYSVFLSLMLSLVPTSFDFISDKVIEKSSEGSYLDSIPFRVIGLQQVFQEGELLLNIAVVPKISETSQFYRTRSKKPKNEKRSCTPFQNILTKFFASNTLQSLCPWLEELSYFAISNKGDLISSPPGSRYESCLEDGTYLPPVPHVTTRPLSTFLSVNPDPMAASRVFCIPVSFFWQTIDTEEHLQPHIPKNVEQEIVNIQNTMSLIYKSLFMNTLSMMGVLHRIFQENLEVVGLRLLYINDSVFNNPSAIHPQGQLTSRDIIQGPVLALALRGSDARSVWLDAVGPSDPILAQRTDPKSIMANYGGNSRDELVIYCPRNPNRINYELSFWFGGRVPPGGVVDLKSLENSSSRSSESGKKKKGKKGVKKDSQLDESLDEFPVIRTHISTLVASTLGDIFLTIAPLVPPVCLGMILSVCHKRGFLICGVKRMRLNSKRAASLGISGAQVRIFSPVSCTTPTSPKNCEDELRSSIESGFPTTTCSPMPSTILLLRKENSLHHSSSLQETLMVTLSVKGILAAIKEKCGAQLTSILCFHVTPYSDNLLTTLGGDFNKVPSYERFSSSSVPPSFYSNPELEQIVVTAFTGAETLRNVGDSLGILLGMSLNKEDHFTSMRERGLELLGLKFIPSLNMAQAKELTPFEVGTSNWQESIQFFSSQPSLICIMRGVDAFQRVHVTLKTPITPRSRRQLPQDALRVVMSLSPEIAYRQAAHFFRDHELFADPTMRENLKFLPPLRSPSLEELSTARFSWAEDPPLSPGGKKKVKGGTQKNSKGTLIVEESIFKTMLTGPRLLTTLLLIKPFAVNKYLSKILKRVLQEDFTIVAIKLLLLSPDQASVLVPSETRSDRIISSMHLEHLMSGPCLALCLLRENAVKKLLDLLGPANPREAKQKNQFLWRGLYGADPVNNALHGSESYANAVKEIKLLFPDGLSCTETPDLKADRVSSVKLYFINHVLAFMLLTYLTKCCSLSGVSASPSEISLHSHSALCQTNCLLLTPILQLLDVGNHRKGYVDVIDSLLSHGFEIVAMRMFWLTRNQADDFLTLHDSPSPDVSKMLCHGPCIAIAVQRDNAVNCFETSLGR